MKHITLVRAAALGMLLALATAIPPRIQASDTKCCESAACGCAKNPLASWNDTAPKKAIIDFVKKTTAKGSPEYIAPADRVAVFDNDGTLWSEQPMYFQFLFALDLIKTLAPRHPEWKTKEPFASLLRGDMKAALAGGEKALYEIVVATHGNISADEFRRLAQDWIATARHPKLQRPYVECIYQPMLEALCYLRCNGFKTYIVTGGDAEFVRAFAEKAYGIPPGQVVGSLMKSEYKLIDGKPAVMRLPDFFHVNDGAGKPVGIVDFMGLHPVIAFGNSDGDYEMLEYTTRAAAGLRLGLLVHHTDAAREFAYDRDSHIGKLDRGLDDAAGQSWILIDMKGDWNTVYPPAK